MMKKAVTDSKCGQVLMRWPGEGLWSAASVLMAIGRETQLRTYTITVTDAHSVSNCSSTRIRMANKFPRLSLRGIQKPTEGADFSGQE